MAVGYEIERLIVKLVGDVEQYKSAMAQAVDATKQATSAIGDTVKGAGKAFAALTAPLAAVAGKAAQSSMGFEHSMALIQGLAGQSKEQVAQWGEQVLALAPTVGKAPEELAHGLYMLASGGLSGQAAMDALALAAKLSAAGMGEVSTIARPIKAAMNAYAGSGLTAAQAADTLTAAVQQSKLEADALAPVIGRVIPLASSMGVSFSEALGPMAAMTRTGSSAAEAGVGLTAFLSTLLKPSRQAQRELAGVGLKFEDLRDVVKGPNGVFNVMTLLEDAFKNNTSALSRIFPNLRAMRGVTTLLSQDGEKVSDILGRVRDSTGALGVAFGAVADTGMFKLQQRTALAQAALVEVGKTVREVIGPAFVGIAVALQLAVSAWRSLGEETKRGIVGWVGAAMAAVALMGALKGVTLLLGMLKLGQLASAAAWFVWSAAVLAAKVALAVFTFTLGVLKLGLSGALVSMLLITPAIVLAKAATWLWNAALAVLAALLSPAAIVGVAVAAAGLAAAFTFVAAAVMGAWEAGKQVLGFFQTLPTAYGPIAHIGGLFREWGTILREVWTLAASGQGQAAWQLLAAGAQLAFSQVRDLLPPLWSFIKDGFLILWDLIGAAFDAKFAATMAKARIQVGRLYGESERTAKEAAAQDESARFAAEAAAQRAGARLAKLAGGFAVPVSQATQDAQKNLDALRQSMTLAESPLGGIDVDALAAQGEWALAQHAVEAVGSSTQATTSQLQKATKAAKELRVESAGFFTAEAMSRAEAFREAFSPSLSGEQGATKSEQLLGQIAENTRKTAEEPGVDIEGAGFDEEF